MSQCIPIPGEEDTALWAFMGRYGQELAGAFPGWERFAAVAEGIAEDKRRAEECDIFGESA